MTIQRRLLAALAAGSLLLAACGDDTDTSDPAPDPGGEVTDDGTSADDASADDAAGDDGTSADDASDDDGATDDGGAAAADVLAAIAASDLGDILVDADGLSLYGFTNDVDGVPACYDACADAWPPILVDGEVVVGDGLDASIFSTVERTDGTTQLVAGAWPLYLFAGDGAPGDVNGQGSGDVWFLVTPDGGLVRDAGDEAAAAMSSDY